jgi:hypothetical protein
MNLKKTLIALALVSVSGQALAEAQSWTTIDNLVNASGNIVTTFDGGIKAISGTLEYAPVGGIMQDGSLYQHHMKQEDVDAYNLAVMNVTVDDYSLSAAEYLAEQASQAQGNLDAAVDQYVNAASIFIEATRVAEMAQTAQETGDATQAQAVQDYVNTNNVLITTADVTEYNEALDTVELAAETWATIEAVYQNGEAVAGLQTQADQAGVDFANAGDLFLDRFSEATQSAAIIFDHNAMDAAVIFVDVQSNLKTIEEMNMAGEQGGFYTTGPTQNSCFFDMESPECVNGTP